MGTVRGLFCCYGGTNDDIPDDAEQHAVSCEDMQCSMQVQKCNPKKVTYCCGDWKCELNSVCDEWETVKACPLIVIVGIFCVKKSLVKQWKIVLWIVQEVVTIKVILL